MLTLLLIILPIISAAALFLLHKSAAKQVSLISSFLSLAVALLTIFQFDTAVGYQFEIIL